MEIDWKNPDYHAVNRERYSRLLKIRAEAKRDPKYLEKLRAYYREAPGGIATFLNHWAVTMDPRVSAKNRMPLMPFLLFPKQIELVEYVIRKWRAGDLGIVVKSRDVGASWVGMCTGAALCLFHPNFMMGVGSATEIKLDRSGDPDTLFYKLRMFLQNIPTEFRAGWTLEKNSAYMRCNFPSTGSSITGEAGDQCGRGGRKSLFIVDEAAHFEHPKLIDASLAATTDCRIDMSSVNGSANSFYEKAHNPAIERFDFSWRDDPRKDDDWYAKKTSDLDPIIVAQEIDCDFSASVEGVVIPSAWVQAAIGLDEKLGITPTGVRVGALDVADRGLDKNAFAIRHGVLLQHVESWSGKDSDLLGTTSRAFRICDENQLPGFHYDGDGLGAGIRGDARGLNEKRTETGADGRPKGRPIIATEYRGSASPMYPERLAPRTDRKNEDFYSNRKAQAWWTLKFRFQESWKASRGEPYDPENIVCISRKIPELTRLVAELSQATVKETATGKLQIEKMPDGAASPNLADAVVICYAPQRMALHISDEILNATSRR